MAHIFIPAGMRVVLECTQTVDEPILNTYHVKADHSSIAYADCLTVANVFAGWWDNLYRNMVNTNIVGRQVVVTGTDTAPASQAAVRLNSNGARVGVPLPDGNTFAVKSVTHVAGRRYRGRSFAFPAVTTDLTNADIFNSGYRNAIVNVLNNLITSLNAAGYLLAVASYRGRMLNPIASWINADDAVDSQRRRLAGRG